MSGPHADLLIASLAQAEVAAGRFDRAEALVPTITDDTVRSHLAAHIAFWRGDRRTARRHFGEFFASGKPGVGSVYLDLLRAMQCGLVPVAEKTMTRIPEPQPYIADILGGVILIEKGRRAEGITSLERGVRKASPGYRTVAFHLAAADALAQALQRSGRVPDAIAILEEASRHGKITLAAGKPEWMTVRRHLSRLYRDNGRAADAAAIDAELARLTLSSVTSPSS